MDRISIFFYRLLGYYDKALYRLVIPFIAPLFFPTEDPLLALVWGYMLIPLTTLSRPVGALFFGRLGFFSGHRRSFLVASYGLGVSTLIIAFLPTYAAIGIAAPALLTLCRFGQNFFIAGQATGGALLLLKKHPKANHSWLSSCYESVAEIGALTASVLISLLAYFHAIEILWRFLFILGSFVGLLAFSSGPTEIVPPKPKKYSAHFFQILRKHKSEFFIACLFSGFAYGNYALLMALFIGLVPQISMVSIESMMMLSSSMLLVDIILLPVFGKLCDIVGKSRVTIVAASLLTLIATPSIALLKGASLPLVTGVYFTLITLAVAIVAPFYHWMIELAPEEIDYTFIGLAKALGLQIIGAPLPAIALAFYRWTGELVTIGFLLSALSLSIVIGVLRAKALSTISLKI